MNLAFLVAFLLLVAPASASPAPAADPDCEDDAAVLPAPSPPAWLASEELQGACDVDSEGRLSGDEDATAELAEGNGASGQFAVAAKGPSGSGRYWDVAVSFRAGAGLRGFCLVTTTVGWRHVGANAGLANRLGELIDRVQDFDGDGRDELVVPSSFPLRRNASLAEYAITAAAYDRLEDRFVLDRASTRALRLKIANAYRHAGDARRGRADDRRHYRKASRLLRDGVCAP